MILPLAAENCKSVTPNLAAFPTLFAIQFGSFGWKDQTDSKASIEP